MVLLYCEKGEEVLGYVLGINDIYSMFSLDNFKSEYNIPKEDRALYVYSADIKEEHKRKRLIWNFAPMLLSEAKKKGYKYITLDATGAGFASKFFNNEMAEQYGLSLVKSEEHKQNPEYGTQTFFCFKIKDEENNTQNT